LTGEKQELDRLKLALSEALDRQAATGEIFRVISGSPTSSQPVFEAIVNAGSTLFPDAAISIALPSGDEILAMAIAGASPERAEAWRERFPFPLTREYMHGFAFLEGKVVDIPDVESAPEEFAAGARNFLASGYRAVTMMPMMRGDSAAGVLSVVRASAGPLSSEQFAMLQMFAAQAVIAIEITRLVNEMRQTNAVLATVSDQLAKYISPQLYQSIVKGERRVAIGSMRKKLTVFFSDIADFSEITDQLESEELTALLNRYLTEMSAIAMAHGATIDKFIGDAIVVYFGDPETRGVKEDAAACVRMAIAMQKRMAELKDEWLDMGLERTFELRIGVNTGYCTVGNFGSDERMDYTVIGSEVNLAARLEAAADVGGILLANETYSLVKDWVVAEEREAITVKGFPRPVPTFQVKGLQEKPASQQHIIERNIEGLSIMIDRNQLSQADAIKELEEALAQLTE
jgi:class 3 adenylate cyclase